MKDVELSAVHVHWSERDAAFIAHSEQYPGLTHHDQWSSLAAVNGLIDHIHAALAPARPRTA